MSLRPETRWSGDFQQIYWTYLQVLVRNFSHDIENATHQWCTCNDYIHNHILLLFSINTFTHIENCAIFFKLHAFKAVIAHLFNWSEVRMFKSDESHYCSWLFHMIHKERTTSAFIWCLKTAVYHFNLLKINVVLIRTLAGALNSPFLPCCVVLTLLLSHSKITRGM